MTFHNDMKKVAAWVDSWGGQLIIDCTADEAARLNALAELCMSVYNPKPGDHECVGWIPYTEIKRADGSPVADDVRGADGVCYVGKDNKAMIAVRLDVLNGSEDYCQIALALHEIAHLRFEQHNDDFVAYLLKLQFDFCEMLHKS